MAKQSQKISRREKSDVKRRVVRAGPSNEEAKSRELKILLHSRKLLDLAKALRQLLNPESIRQWISTPDAPLVLSVVGRSIVRSCCQTEGQCSFEKIVGLLPANPESHYTYDRYGHLQLFFGLDYFHQEQYKQALGHFKTALHVAEDLGDLDLVSAANFFSGLAYLHLNDLQAAGSYIRAALEGVEGRLRSAATITNRLEREEAEKLHDLRGLYIAVQGRVLYRLGKETEAKEALSEAENRLFSTEDFNTRGSIRQVLARMSRHRGKDEEAMESLREAVKLYRRSAEETHNLGRALCDLAFNFIITARSQPAKAKSLRSQALRNLNQAEEVLSKFHYPGYLATVYNHRALILCDERRFDDALELAERGHRHAREYHYLVGMSTARRIAALCLLRLEQSGSRVRALDYANEAWILVKSGQNVRQKVYALLTRARALLGQEPPRSADSKVCVREAEKLLPEHHQDFLRAELEELKEATASAAYSAEAPLVVISHDKAFSQPLKDTLHEVTDAIVKAGVAYFGRPHKVRTRLKIGAGRMQESLVRITESNKARR